MRPNLFTLTLLAALVATAGAWRHFEDQRREERVVDATRLARQRIHSEIRLRSALANADVNASGWVVDVDPAWFGPAPMNPLLGDPTRPWLEIDRDATERMHEPASIEAGPTDAQWWYNPANGRVCARVPAQSTESRTRDLHHAVND